MTQRALQQILRWAHRPNGRQVLLGPKSTAVTITEIWLLDAVFSGPVRASTLAGWQAVDKSTMTSQVNRLAARGLVSRRPDPRDGRAVLITMTPKGRRLQRDLAAHGARTMDAVTSDWPEEDRTRLAELLRRLAEQLSRFENKDIDRGPGADAFGLFRR